MLLDGCVTLVTVRCLTVRIFLQDFGDARLTATHQFSITISRVTDKAPIFLHTERYHFRTPEVVDGGTAIPCATPRFVGNVLAVDGDTQLEADITYSLTGCKLSPTHEDLVQSKC